MKNGQADVGDLGYFLAATTDECAWIRTFIDLRSGAAVATYAEVLVSPRPDTWRHEEIWAYEDCMFVARAIPTSQLPSWLRGECPGFWKDVGRDGVTLPISTDRYSVTREPSRAQHDRHQSAWPTLHFTGSLQVDHQFQHLPHGFLTGDAAPSFPQAAGAFNAFFYDDFRVTGVNAPSLGRLDIRFADGRGSLERVIVTPSALRARVGGTARSLRIELNSATQRSEASVPKDRHVEIPLSEGLPVDAWLWLKEGTDWVDYRSLGGWPAYQSRDVEYELPDDPESDLSAIISQGEGEHLEFKSQLPDVRDPEAKRHTFKTVAAFAMRGGGRIIFGVEDRTGQILGIAEGEEVSTQRFTSMLRSLVRPTPGFSLRFQRLDGKCLLVVEVPSSQGRLHALTIDPDKPEYYIRRGATTFYARPEELTAVLEDGTSRLQPPWPSLNVFGQ